jgi:1,4-dihydroxy-2-naphthoate polyprenyltransferase
MDALKAKKTLWKGFWQVADPKIWVASAVPMAAGAVLAFTLEGAFSRWEDWLWLAVAAAGIFLIEIGKNALNEVIDYNSGADPGVDEAHRTPFSGGKKAILDGALSVKQCAAIAFFTFLAAMVIGLLIVILRHWEVLWMGLAGSILAVIYSLPPFKLCYRGWGELAVGITFGPLVLLGMYVTLTGHYAVMPLLVSLPLGALIANVLWINQFPDYEADRDAGKRNGVVRLGKKRASAVYVILFVLCYLAVIGIAVYARSAIWLIALGSLPLAIIASQNCIKNHDDIKKLVKSNVYTVLIFQITGGLLIIAALLHRFVL